MVISRHIRNILKEGELDEKSVVAKNATTASDGKTYQVEFYNLDMILSLGYRVNSKRATAFRIWATRVLKEHLIKGYSVNQKRLREKGLEELSQTIDLLKSTIEGSDLALTEAKGLLDVIVRYSRTWTLLQGYDEDRLEAKEANLLHCAIQKPDAVQAKRRTENQR